MRLFWFVDEMSCAQMVELDRKKAQSFAGLCELFCAQVCARKFFVSSLLHVHTSLCVRESNVVCPNGSSRWLKSTDACSQVSCVSHLLCMRLYAFVAYMYTFHLGFGLYTLNAYMYTSPLTCILRMSIFGTCHHVKDAIT